MRCTAAVFRAVLLFAGIIAVAPAFAVSNSSAVVADSPKDLIVQALKLAPGAAPAALTLPPIDARLIDEAKQANASAFQKRLQIGIGRTVRTQLDATWIAVAGGFAAHWEITSPGAQALRVEIDTAGIPPDAQVRFAGRAQPDTVYGPFAASEFAAGSASRWSPVLAGETALVEVFVAAPTSAPTLTIDQVSHIFAAPWNPTSESLPKASGSCEVDFVCRAATDAALAEVGKAVAKMVFNDGSGSASSYLCTGTLLNPLGGPVVPYFYGANHCISTQAAASTLTTHWFYDRTGCGTGATSPNYVQVPGGATLLYANVTSDALLLRLNASPPAGAVLAAWDSATVSGGAAVTAVHHPVGDWKKVSLGTIGGFGNPEGAGTNFIISNWNAIATGVTEGGSSGSGIFTFNGTQYNFRGGLFGGPSSCTAAPSQLHDFYSRFDQVYPSIAQFLNPGAATCAVTLSPTSVTVSASAASGSFTVTVSAGCAWGVTTDSPAWLVSSSNGIGNGTVSYSIATNSGAERVGTLTVGGVAFTVTQLASAVAGVNILDNPGFETGTAVWTQSATGGYPIITNDASLAHSGAWYAWLGGYNSGTDTLYQAVAIPAGGAASLRFWYWIQSQETGTTVYDRMTVSVRDAASGLTLATLATYTNVNVTNGAWVQSPTYDLSAFVGQTVLLVFQATMDDSFVTNFFVDDIELNFTQAAVALNYQGLWWNSSESGWGINLAHQGDLIYLTWYTYDATGKGAWLAMLASKTAPNTYSGQIVEVHGSPYTAVPYNPAAKVVNNVGTGTLTFTNASTGNFSFTAKNVTRNIAITKFSLGGPVPVCTYVPIPNFAAASNFQDLWWGGASQDGWGINFAHEGNLIYATWYTYDIDGSPLWFASLMSATGPNTYSGAVLRGQGPAFGPTFNPGLVVISSVGTASLTFANGNAATFNYTIGAASGSKSLTRFLFGIGGGTVCQ